MVERLVERHRATEREAIPEYRAWRAELGERELDLMVPLTFMNASGEALEVWRARHGLAIEADVSHLAVGDSLHVRDLVVPNVTILSDMDSTIATVVPPTVMEEKPAEEAAVATEGAEPEVIAKGKKDDEEGDAKPEKGAAKEKEKK